MVYYSFNKETCKHGLLISGIHCSKCVEEERELQRLKELEEDENAN